MISLLVAAALTLAATPASAQTSDKMGWNWEAIPKHMAALLQEGFIVVAFHRETTREGFDKTFYLQKGPALIQCSQTYFSATKAAFHNCGQLVAPK